MRYLTLIITMFLLLHQGSAQVTPRQTQERNRGIGDGESYFYRESPRNFQLMYVTGAFEGKEHSNAIISEMGKLAGVNPVNSFRTTFNYVEKLNIDKINDQFNLRFSLKQSGFSNLRDVYGFDVSSLLVPDRMSFRLQLLNEQGNVVYEQTYTGLDVSFLEKNQQYREVVNLTVADEIRRSGGTLRVTEVLTPVAQLKFYHSAAKKNQFKEFATLMLKYRSDAALLADIITRIERYDPSDLDRIKEFLDELEYSKTDYDRITDADYEKKLHLRVNDPEKLLPMLASFSTLYHEKKVDLQRILRTLDDAYYQRGMSHFDRREYRVAMQWFQKAVDFNPSYAPAHYRMAWIDYKDGKVEPARQRGYHILASEMKMDGRLSMEVSALLDEIHTRATGAWLDQAAMMISRGDYQGAEQLIDRIQSYYHQYPLSRYSKAFTDILYGYQLALLETGETLLQRKQYSQALELLQQGLLISRQYGLKLPFDVERMLEQARMGIFTDLLVSGQRAMNVKDFDGAAFYLVEAMTFFDQRLSPMAQTALDTYQQTFLESMITEGRRLIQHNDFGNAIALFERAQEAQYLYGIRNNLPFASLINEAREGYVLMKLDEGRLLAERKNFGMAIQVLKEVGDYMSNHVLSGMSSVRFSEVSGELLSKMLYQIDVLNRSKNFAEALGLVEDAKYVCRYFSSSCQDKMVMDREVVARSGEHTLMVEQARKAFNDGHLTDAKSQLERAADYRHRYADMVDGSADEALLAGKIRGKEYQMAMVSGKSHLDRKEYRQALPYFDEAVRLEALGGFTYDRKLDGYRKQAAVKVILEEADQLSRMLDEGGLMATKDKLLHLMTLRTRYHLNDDPEIDARLQNLQLRMVSAACLKQKEQYDQHLRDAYEHALNKDFLSADIEIGKALKVAAELPECNIDDTTATRYRVQLTPAIRYQKKMSEAMQYLRDYRNTEAVEAYAAAGELFIRGNVAIYKLEHEMLEVFALRQNQSFILAAAFYFREHHHHGFTMKMLRELASKGYPASQTRLLQEQLGFILGKEDRVLNPASAWKTAVLKHTGGDKFFKYFRKAYGKGWKQG